MKYKILYISAVVPDTTSGGRFAMYRHLIIKNDFEVAVASTNSVDLPIAHQLNIRRNRLVERIRRTKLSRLIYNLEYIINWFYLPSKLLNFAIEFKPNAILCVVDDWHIGLAYQLAKHLNIPLVVNFQDLFCLSQFVSQSSRPYKIITSWLVKKYHYINNVSSHSFYTSEGMREWFGNDARGDVLYPIGDFGIHHSPEVLIPPSRFSQEDKVVTITYAGNCYGAYGRMMLRLAEVVKLQANLHPKLQIKLQIFAAGNDWESAKLQEMQDAGIYQGFKPFSELKSALDQSDAFLTVMSFEGMEKTFMKTSFTTKWLDYVPYHKPVFVWGPDYSTAVKFANKHQAAVTVCEDNPNMLLQAMISLVNDQAKWDVAAKNSALIANTLLNPNEIHRLFVENLVRVCEQVT